MRKRIIRFGVILLGSFLLAACGQAALPNANPNPPAVSAPVSAPTVGPLATANQSTPTVSAPAVTPLATATSKSSSTSSTNNCTALSKDDVSKVLGEAVQEVRDPSHHGVLCVYQTKNLILEANTLHEFGGYLNSVKYMQDIRASLGDLALVVPGLGEEAFYNHRTAYILLLVRLGDTVYSFGVRGVSGNYLSLEETQSKEKPLAELLLSRLP